MRRNDREISGIEEVEEIIRKADVCRIALANDNVPYLVTMNFGYNNEGEQKLFFHCSNEGRKLGMIRQNNYVCFEMDTDHQIFRGTRGCDWGMRYRSVVGYGNISIIMEREEKISALNCIMSHYGGEGEYYYDNKVLARTIILRLDIKEMTAKKC